MSKLVKKRPLIDRRRFSPVFPIPELQQTAIAKDKSCTYISNKNRWCSLFSRWINPAAISNNKPFRSSPPKTSASKKPLLLGVAGDQSQDSQFHAKGTPDGLEMCIIMQYWHPRRKVIFLLLLLVWAIKTSSSIYLKFFAICRGNSCIFVVRKHLNFRPVGCALGMKFESCDWCPAPPSSNGFFAALVFGGELWNGLLFEIAAGFIHRENRLHRRFSFEI